MQKLSLVAIYGEHNFQCNWLKFSSWYLRCWLSLSNARLWQYIWICIPNWRMSNLHLNQVCCQRRLFSVVPILVLSSSALPRLVPPFLAHGNHLPLDSRTLPISTSGQTSPQGGWRGAEGKAQKIRFLGKVLYRWPSPPTTSYMKESKSRKSRPKTNLRPPPTHI